MYPCGSHCDQSNDQIISPTFVQRLVHGNDCAHVHGCVSDYGHGRENGRDHGNDRDCDRFDGS